MSTDTMAFSGRRVPVDRVIANVKSLLDKGLVSSALRLEEIRDAIVYLRLLHNPAALAEILRGGEIGYTILLHEIEEIRFLRSIGCDPLDRSGKHRKEMAHRLGVPKEAIPLTRVARQVFLETPEAHLHATREEYSELQRIIQRRFGLKFELGTLLVAHPWTDPADLAILSEQVALIVEVDEIIEQARQIIHRLIERK